MTAAMETTTDAAPAETAFPPVAGSADAEASRLAFRHWLLNGGGLYGVNGERSSGKRRSKKKSKLQEGHPDEPQQSSMPAMEARAVSSGGKKKTRRWLNDMLLRELAGPLDASDVANLYAPPPWGAKTHRPALERITEISAWHAERLDRSLWDLILSSDMEQREKVLTMAGHSGNMGNGASSAAVDAWRHVSGPAKEALKRSAHWPMVAMLEEKLLLLKHGLHSACIPPLEDPPEETLEAGDLAVRAIPKDSAAALAEGTEMVVDTAEPHALSSGPVLVADADSGDQGAEAGRIAEEGAQTVLLFGTDDSFVRLVIHGLCQFHGLHSRSLSVGEARVMSAGHRVPPDCADWDTAERVVFVSSNDVPPGGVLFRLSDVLSAGR